MKNLIAGGLFLFVISSVGIVNKKVKEYKFLGNMYWDNYFLNHIVDKGKAIFLKFCKKKRKGNPKGEVVYKFTHTDTISFNNLNNKFCESGSEIETVAMDNIGNDIKFILKAYDYNLDIEDAIAPGDW